MIKPLLIGVVLLASQSSQAQELAPFTSDGCSAFPDGTLLQQ